METSINVKGEEFLVGLSELEDNTKFSITFRSSKAEYVVFLGPSEIEKISEKISSSSLYRKCKATFTGHKDYSLSVGFTSSQSLEDFKVSRNVTERREQDDDSLVLKIYFNPEIDDPDEYTVLLGFLNHVFEEREVVKVGGMEDKSIRNLQDEIGRLKKEVSFLKSYLPYFKIVEKLQRDLREPETEEEIKNIKTQITSLSELVLIRLDNGTHTGTNDQFWTWNNIDLDNPTYFRRGTTSAQANDTVTILKDGVYDVTIRTSMTATATVMKLLKNGNNNQIAQAFCSCSSALNHSFQIRDVFRFTANDFLQIKQTTTGQAVNNGNPNNVWIIQKID